MTIAQVLQQEKHIIKETLISKVQYNTSQLHTNNVTVSSSSQ